MESNEFRSSLVECPHCGRLINIDKLEDHIEKDHSGYEKYEGRTPQTPGEFDLLQDALKQEEEKAVKLSKSARGKEGKWDYTEEDKPDPQTYDYDPEELERARIRMKAEHDPTKNYEYQKGQELSNEVKDTFGWKTWEDEKTGKTYTYTCPNCGDEGAYDDPKHCSNCGANLEQKFDESYAKEWDDDEEEFDTPRYYWEDDLENEDEIKANHGYTDEEWKEARKDFGFEESTVSVSGPPAGTHPPANVVWDELDKSEEDFKSWVGKTFPTEHETPIKKFSNLEDYVKSHGEASEYEEPSCPNCGSDDMIYRTTTHQYKCKKCGKTWNTNWTGSGSDFHPELYESPTSMDINIPSQYRSNEEYIPEDIGKKTTNVDYSSESVNDPKDIAILSQLLDNELAEQKEGEDEEEDIALLLQLLAPDEAKAFEFKPELQGKKIKLRDGTIKTVQSVGIFSDDVVTTDNKTVKEKDYEIVGESYGNESEWKVHTITQGVIPLTLGRQAEKTDAINAVRRMYFDDGFIDDKDILSAVKIGEGKINSDTYYYDYSEYWRNGNDYQRAGLALQAGIPTSWSDTEWNDLPADIQAKIKDAGYVTSYETYDKMSWEFLPRDIKQRLGEGLLKVTESEWNTSTYKKRREILAEEEFREQEHPRDEGGQFTSKGGGGKHAKTSDKDLIKQIKGDSKDYHDWSRNEKNEELYAEIERRNQEIPKPKKPEGAGDTIFRDDPDAIKKMEAKVKYLEDVQDYWKKIIKFPARDYHTKSIQLGDAKWYELTNIGANLRDAKNKLEGIKAQQERGTTLVRKPTYKDGKKRFYYSEEPPENWQKGGESYTKESISDKWWWDHVNWESGFDQDFLWCKHCGKELLVDADRKYGNIKDESLNDVVPAHLRIHGMESYKKKANELDSIYNQFTDPLNAPTGKGIMDSVRGYSEPEADGQDLTGITAHEEIVEKKPTKVKYHYYKQYPFGRIQKGFFGEVNEDWWKYASYDEKAKELKDIGFGLSADLNTTINPLVYRDWKDLPNEVKYMWGDFGGEVELSTMYQAKDWWDKKYPDRQWKNMNIGERQRAILAFLRDPDTALEATEVGITEITWQSMDKSSRRDIVMDAGYFGNSADPLTAMKEIDDIVNSEWNKLPDWFKKTLTGESYSQEHTIYDWLDEYFVIDQDEDEFGNLNTDYICRLCGKDKFSGGLNEYESMGKHLRLEHNIKSPHGLMSGESKGFRYEPFFDWYVPVCNKCNKRFTLEIDAVNHLEKEHGIIQEGGPGSGRKPYASKDPARKDKAHVGWKNQGIDNYLAKAEQDYERGKTSTPDEYEYAGYHSSSEQEGGVSPPAVTPPSGESPDGEEDDMDDDKRRGGIPWGYFATRNCPEGQVYRDGKCRDKSNEGGKGSGRRGHKQWMRSLEEDPSYGECNNCKVITEKVNGKCQMCGRKY